MIIKIGRQLNGMELHEITNSTSGTSCFHNHHLVQARRPWSAPTLLGLGSITSSGLNIESLPAGLSIARNISGFPEHCLGNLFLPSTPTPSIPINQQPNKNKQISLGHNCKLRMIEETHVGQNLALTWPTGGSVVQNQECWGVMTSVGCLWGRLKDEPTVGRSGLEKHVIQGEIPGQVVWNASCSQTPPLCEQNDLAAESSAGSHRLLVLSQMGLPWIFLFLPHVGTFASCGN